MKCQYKERIMYFSTSELIGGTLVDTYEGTPQTPLSLTSWENSVISVKCSEYVSFFSKYVLLNSLNDWDMPWVCGLKDFKSFVFLWMNPCLTWKKIENKRDLKKSHKSKWGGLAVLAINWWCHIQDMLRWSPGSLGVQWPCAPFQICWFSSQFVQLLL